MCGPRAIGLNVDEPAGHGEQAACDGGAFVGRGCVRCARRCCAPKRRRRNDACVGRRTSMSDHGVVKRPCSRRRVAHHQPHRASRIGSRSTSLGEPKISSASTGSSKPSIAAIALSTAGLRPTAIERHQWSQEKNPRRLGLTRSAIRGNISPVSSRTAPKGDSPACACAHRRRRFDESTSIVICSAAGAAPAAPRSS